MSCRLYIDEVGNSDLKGSATDDNIRYLSLTGIIVKDAHHERQFQPHVRLLKQTHFPSVDPDKIILHRREIMRREGAFECLKDDFQAREFDTGLLGLFHCLPYIALTVAIDKREHLARYGVWHFDPYHYCLRVLIERYVLWLKRNGLTGDVAIEPRFKKSDKRVKASFGFIYEKGTDHIPAKYIQRYLTSKEIKFFSKEKNIAAMQIVDLLAAPSLRSMKLEALGMPEPGDFTSKVAEVLIRRRYSRHPHTKVITGWGRKWLP